MQVKNIPSVEEAEATTTLKAVEFACDLDLSHVILEGDALNITNAVKASEHVFQLLGTLSKEFETVVQLFKRITFNMLDEI